MAKQYPGIEKMFVDYDVYLTEEELEAQRTDAAERENHRQEVEGDIDEIKRS